MGKEKMKDRKGRYFEDDPTEYFLDDDGRPIIPCSPKETQIIKDAKAREKAKEE